ncbi:MAG: WbqC family protein [Bacteroidales bacterium]
MSEEVLLSTAYFPPVEYFSVVARSRQVLIEREENYLKQTYRNRCVIMGSNGPLPLVVPVLRGSFHKTAIKDLRIDNSRRWRDLHLRGIRSAYAAAPFFEFYFDIINDVISGNHLSD